MFRYSSLSLAVIHFRIVRHDSCSDCSAIALVVRSTILYVYTADVYIQL